MPAGTGAILRTASALHVADTALTVGNDPTPVDGAAWFQVDPKAVKVDHQGYVGVAGTYLLMPSLVRSGSDTLDMGFSMTSPTLNPSTGYVVSKNQGNTFSPVRRRVVGSGPHLSFSHRFWLHEEPLGRLLADRARPGHRERLDGRRVHSFDPRPDTADNWGTRVWEVTR